MTKYTKKHILLVLSGALILMLSRYFIFTGNNKSFEEPDYHLPRPVVDPQAQFANTYKIRSTSSSSSDMSMTVIIRTYSKFVAKNATDKLLTDFDSQLFGHNKPFPISAVVLSTDSDSIDLIRNKVHHHWNSKSVFRNLETHFHYIPANVYSDNCCQTAAMCEGSFKEVWSQAAHRVYKKYKNIEQKMHTACAGNNLMHYVLTDLALQYVVDSCHNNCDQKLLVVTNGDNSYKVSFADKVMHYMRVDPSLDALMVNYLERGKEVVRAGLGGNSMDLGCMVFRISALQRLKAGFLTPHKDLVNAWPHHYYGADNMFMKYIHEQRGAKIGFLPEILFMHW